MTNIEKKKYNKKKLVYTPDLYKNKVFSDNKKFLHPFPCVIPQIEENIDILEESVHVKDRLKSKTYICRNTGAFISCIEKSEGHIIVGLKSDMKPFNIFEKKQGKSVILIFDNALESVNTIKLEYGDVIQLKYTNKKLYALFSNGYLIEITNLKTGAFKVLFDTHKIISFDVDDTAITFTDGVRVFYNDNFKVYNGVICKTLFYMNHIIMLELTGRVVASSLDLNESFEIVFKSSIFNVKVVDTALVVLLHLPTNKAKFEIEKQVLFPFAKSQEEMKVFQNKFIYFFNATGAGVIESYKKYKNKRKINKIFQVYRADDEDCFHVRFANFKEDCRCFVPDVIDNGDSFIFCTEDGLILKVSYY